MSETEKTAGCRKKGAGTLQLRGKKYLAIWVVNGKRYTRSTGTGIREDAEAKLAEFVKPFQEKTELEIIENLQAKVRVQETRLKDTRNREQPALKVCYMIDAWKNDLQTTDVAWKTEEHYTGILNLFEKECGVVFAKDVDSTIAKKFLESIKKRCTVGTYNQYLVCLKMMFNIAMRVDYRVRLNPFEEFKKLREPKTQRRELTTEEVGRLIDEAKKVSYDIGALFVIGAYTGMRKSDICTFSWDEIDLKNDMLRYLPMKTRKNGVYAEVPIHPEVRKYIDEAKHHDGHNFLYPNLKKIWESKYLTHKINQVFDACKIPRSVEVDGKKKVDTAFHALRVYFASQCARSGMPIKQIMKMLAHTKPDMSLHYVDTQMKDMRLPDFDDSHDTLILKKETVEALKKACGTMDIDDFIMTMLTKGVADVGSVVKYRQDKELEDIIDEVMGK